MSLPDEQRSWAGLFVCCELVEPEDFATPQMGIQYKKENAVFC